MKSSRNEDFIIFIKKFNGVRDEDVVAAFKRGDEDAQVELVKRYTIHIKKLAGEIYRQYKNNYFIEFDDLFSIGLASLFTIISKSDLKNGVYRYWKKSTTNEMIQYITHSDYSCLDKKTQEYLEKDRYLAKSNVVYDSSNSSLLIEDVEKILYNPTNRFRSDDAYVYLLTIKYGYSAQEIADMLGLRYHNVRRKIVLVRERIKKYFV